MPSRADFEHLDLITETSAAYTSLRNCCHIRDGRSIPAPAVYSLTADLSASADLLRQVIDRIAQGLARSLSDQRIDVIEDGGGDPTVSAGEAVDDTGR
jgi:hypothetical protein